jgi:upstream activation factor subunit UAF30
MQAAAAGRPRAQAGTAPPGNSRGARGRWPPAAQGEKIKIPLARTAGHWHPLLAEFRNRRRYQPPALIQRINGRYPMAKKRKAAKKSKKAKKSGRKPNPAFMKPMNPSATLAAVIGGSAMPRTEVTKKLWAYIKRNGLQDRVNRRMINADDKLKPVFGGKSQVSMFEMTRLVNNHLR